MSREIFITEADKQKLHKLIENEKEFGIGTKEYLINLQQELNRACVVQAQEIPGDVITMNSKVVLKNFDTGEDMTYTLVYPSEANLEEDKISVLAPIGTAILGYREQDILDWEVPGGTVRLKVEKILYQPEAAGHFDL